MVEPEKPFACTLPDCGMTFTNEDHLNVHTKKHDMVLQFGSEQKAGFVADQTPTPTRFIRTCEEVGLFQDLQNVTNDNVTNENVTDNPFDEGFKRAMETKQGILCLENAIATSTSDDVLHTPQLVFPLDDPTLSLLQSHRSGISRSSSYESSTIKAYEAALSKITHEVTVNRVDHETTVKQIDISKSNDMTKTSIQTNNSVEVIKDKDIPIIVCSNVKANALTKDMVFNDNNKFLAPDKVPLISQKSLDFVVDSLTNEAKITDEKVTVSLKRNISNVSDGTKIGINKIVKVIPKVVVDRHTRPRILPRKAEINSSVGEYEVFIKLPNGKQVRMKPVEEHKEPNTKEILRNNILKKTTFSNKIQTTKTVIKKAQKDAKVVTNVLKIPTGTLIPVTLVNQAGAPLSNDDLSKVPITKIDNVNTLTKITVPALTKISNKVITPVTPVTITKTSLTTKTSPVMAKGTLVPIINTPKISNIRSLATTITETIPKETPILAPVTKSNLTINENFKRMPVTDRNTQVSQMLPTVTTLVTRADTTNNNIIGNEVFTYTQEDLNKVILCKSGGVSTNVAPAAAEPDSVEDSDDDCVIEDITNNPEIAKRTKFELESRSAASKRYRERLKSAIQAQAAENKLLREANHRLATEKAVLRLLITEHMKRCPDAEDLRLLTPGKLQVMEDS